MNLDLTTRKNSGGTTSLTSLKTVTLRITLRCYVFMDHVTQKQGFWTSVFVECSWSESSRDRKRRSPARFPRWPCGSQEALGTESAIRRTASTAPSPHGVNANGPRVTFRDLKPLRHIHDPRAKLQTWHHESVSKHGQIQGRRSLMKSLSFLWPSSSSCFFRMSSERLLSCFPPRRRCCSATLQRGGSLSTALNFLFPLCHIYTWLAKWVLYSCML